MLDRNVVKLMLDRNVIKLLSDQDVKKPHIPAVLLDEVYTGHKEPEYIYIGQQITFFFLFSFLFIISGMDKSYYQALLHFLETLEYPISASTDQQRFIHTNKKKYFSDKHLLYYRGDHPRIVLTKEQVPIVFQQYHNSPLGGHYAFKNTYLKISKKYYWPGMRKDIEQSTMTCPRCQTKGKEQLQEPLHPITVPCEPFQQIAMDIKHVAQSRGGHRYIIVAIDYYSKWVEARALMVANSLEVTNFFLEEVIARHSVPKVIISDNGTPFANSTLASLCSTFHITHRFISPYHASGNGLVERFNRTLGVAMRMLSVDHKPDWHLYLPLLLFSYRTIIQASTRYSPFKLLYGRSENTIADNLLQPSIIDFDEEKFNEKVVQSFVDQKTKIEAIRRKAADNIAKAQEKQKQYIERRILSNNTSFQPPFLLGERVLLFNDIHAASSSMKLEDRYEGPYIVQQTYQNSTYQLKTMQGELLPRRVHGNKLKIYKNPELDLFYPNQQFSLPNGSRNPSINRTDHSHSRPFRWKPVHPKPPE